VFDTGLGCAGGQRGSSWLSPLWRLLGWCFLAVGYLISDEKGLPVPTTFAGGQCWLTTRGIDVLDCRELGRGFYVGWMGRWQPTRRCRVLNPRLLCCELPYALRIDPTGDYPRVASVPSSG
jgi:hypothetical protein